MNSQDDFPLDSFGIEPPKSQPNSKERHQRELADLVSTVIALDHSRPLRPSANSLHTIVEKISTPAQPHISQRIIAWSGWAAAAAITLFFLLTQKPSSKAPSATLAVTDSNPTPSQAPIKNSTSSSAQIHTDAQVTPSAATDNQSNSSSSVADSSTLREQQRSLIQEIDTLRKEVTRLASRDQERLTVQNGVSWPIVMKLTSPNSDARAAIIRDPVLAALFKTNASDIDDILDPEKLDTIADASTVNPDPLLPSAIPIYDPARDSGQLIINNLNAPGEGQAYYLWAQSDNANQPVLVGSLPEQIASSETFDFRLGAFGIIPNRFLITQSSLNSPTIPTPTNTILVGPQQPGK